MKKLILILGALLLLGMAVTSCRSSERCAAYGEAKKYKIERAY